MTKKTRIRMLEKAWKGKSQQEKGWQGGIVGLAGPEGAKAPELVKAMLIATWYDSKDRFDLDDLFGAVYINPPQEYTYRDCPLKDVLVKLELECKRFLIGKYKNKELDMIDDDRVWDALHELEDRVLEFLANG